MDGYKSRASVWLLGTPHGEDARQLLINAGIDARERFEIHIGLNPDVRRLLGRKGPTGEI